MFNLYLQNLKAILFYILIRLTALSLLHAGNREYRK